MNEYFIEGFEKEASLSHFLGRVVGGTGRAASKVVKAPGTAAVNFRRGVAGKTKVTTEQLDKARKYKKLQKKRVADKERIQRQAEIKAQEKVKREAAEEATKKKETRKKIMGYAKPLVAGAAITGGSLYGLDKLQKYKEKNTKEKPPMGYGYYSSGQYKNAGIKDFFAKVMKQGLLGENVNAAAKIIADKGKMTHELSPEQMKAIMEKIEQVKPKIGPATVLGAAMLAGAGAPLGAAIMKKTTDVGEKVLTTDIPINPFKKPEAMRSEHHSLGKYSPIPKSQLFM